MPHSRNHFQFFFPPSSTVPSSIPKCKRFISCHRHSTVLVLALSQLRKNKNTAPVHVSVRLWVVVVVVERANERKFSTHFLGLFAVTARLGACFYSVIREINVEVLQPLIYFNSTCIFNRQHCAITHRRSRASQIYSHTSTSFDTSSSSSGLPFRA